MGAKTTTASAALNDFSLGRPEQLTSEALLSAAAEIFLDWAWIFRFPNVVRPRATLGAIFDFIERLASRPDNLTALGDGSQTKPCLHVAELIDAMNFIDAYYASPFLLTPERIGPAPRLIVGRLLFGVE